MECQQSVCAGAVLALAVFVVSLLAQGDSQGGEVKYCTVLQLCLTLLLVLEKIISSPCFISPIARNLWCSCVLSPLPNLAFLFQKPSGADTQSGCEFFITIRHHSWWDGL